jgi:hypothetical protein
VSRILTLKAYDVESPSMRQKSVSVFVAMDSTCQ